MDSDSQLSLTMAWNEQFSELMKFNQQWGHCDFPQKYAKNPKLGQWVNHWRCQYRLLKSGKKSFTSYERISQLGKTAFQWNYDSQFSLTMAWNEHFQS